MKTIKINQILITVGTTKFDELIKTLDNEDFYESLNECGVQKIIIQKGNGEYIPTKFEKMKLDKLKVEVFQFLNGFEEIIKASDVIISHCGAGTILETLKNKKTFIGTVNTLLMDNHQTELADQLVKERYIHYSETKKVKDLVIDFVKGKLKPLLPYPEIDYNAVPDIIYGMLGV